MSRKAVEEGLFGNLGEGELTGPEQAHGAHHAEKTFSRDERRGLKLQEC